MNTYRLLKLVFCFCTLPHFAVAQWIGMTNLTGTTQNYAGVDVTVTSNLPMTGGGCGGLYWTQMSNSSYTWSFSETVEAIQIMCDAIDATESIQFSVNGVPYNLQSCNVDPTPFVNICSQGNCSIVGGQFINNGFSICGGLITIYGNINSFSVTQLLSNSGTTYNVSFMNLKASNNGPVCTPGNLNLTATGMDPNSYSWLGVNSFSSNLQNPTRPNVTHQDAGEYIVSVTGNCNVTVSDTTDVLISDPPDITDSGFTNPTTCQGADGTIFITGLTPNAPYTVTYDFGGNPYSVNVVANATGIVTVTGLVQGSYTNISLLAGNCPPVPAGNFTLTDPPGPAAPVAASNSPVCENGTITFTAGNVANGNFNWTGPGFSSNLQNPSIANAQLTSEGNYSVTVTVANCLSPATTLFVDITPLPAPPVTAPVEYCQFKPATPLTATGTALLWYTSQTGTGSPVAPTPNTATPGTTTYWVTQTVASCEGPMSSIVVTVKPEPPAPVYTGPVHFCRDEPSSTLTANGQNIQWYDANNNLLPGAPTPSTLVAADFTYFVTQTINGCESPRTTVNIHVAEIPAAPIVADVRQCQFDEQMALTAIGQNIQWYNNLTGGTALINPPIPPTNNPSVNTWFVSQTVDGCESPRAPITVTVLFLPTSTFTASRPLVCENDTLTFTYTGNATPAETYTWTLPNDSAVVVSGATNTAGPIVIRFDSIGTFPLTLNVSNQGCNTSTTYNVRVVVVPEVTISMPQDVCIHDSVTVGIGNYNSAIATYDWDFGGGVNVFSNVNEGPYKVQWSGTGLRAVTVTVGNTACATSTTDTVLIHALPDADFKVAMRGDAICINDSLRLTAIDNNGSYAYQWGPDVFFDQSNNYAPVVNAYIRDAQNIYLTVTTPYGCSATDSTFIDAQQCCTVFLPNAFTPNGDGRNDIFRPVTRGAHAIKTFMIVNRWGKKVFETLDETLGWDGTFNGEDQDMGTYFYILQYKCDGKTMEEKGEVILVR